MRMKFGLGLEVRKNPVVFVHKMVLLKEGLKVFEFFIVSYIETESQRCINLTNIDLPHYIGMIRQVKVFKKLVILGCTGERISYLMWIQKNQIVLLNTH
jgi:hypothetical protein